MAYSECDQLELLCHIGTAFSSVFAEEVRAGIPEFEQLNELFGKIATDWKTIGEIESCAEPDPYMLTLLRLRIDALWNEVVEKLFVKLPLSASTVN